MRRNHKYRSTVGAVSLLAMLTSAGCLSPLLPHQGLQEAEHLHPPVARVRLASDESEYVVRSDSRIVLRVFTNSGEESFSTQQRVRIAVSGQQISVSEDGGVTLAGSASGVLLYAVDERSRIRINGDPYYGSFIFGFENGNLRLINRLNLEQYLKGVLTPELGERKPHEFEAVKAQAVASRTYAIAHLGQYSGKSYDLRADVSDQIYVGDSWQRDWVDRAVDATTGEVLLYDHGLIEAYYHSTCGGQTEAIEDVWGAAPRPYLVAVDDDTSCNWSKYSDWEEVFDEATLVANLRAYRKSAGVTPVPDFTRVLDIRLEGQTPGQRYRRMVVVTPDGEWPIAADQIRWALGRPTRPGTILPSSRFVLELTRNDAGAITRAVAQGTGYGHGVGMCQCGMIGRARAGEEYRSILQHYYTGARIERVY
jgi:stage II sporulation protein D